MSGRELTLLTEGSIELLGLIPRSSNQTFLAQVTCAEEQGYAASIPVRLKPRQQEHRRQRQRLVPCVPSFAEDSEKMGRDAYSWIGADFTTGWRRRPRGKLRLS